MNVPHSHPTRTQAGLLPWKSRVPCTWVPCPTYKAKGHRARVAVLTHIMFPVARSLWPSSRPKQREDGGMLLCTAPAGSLAVPRAPENNIILACCLGGQSNDGGCPVVSCQLTKLL